MPIRRPQPKACVWCPTGPTQAGAPWACGSQHSAAFAHPARGSSTSPAGAQDALPSDLAWPRGSFVAHGDILSLTSPPYTTSFWYHRHDTNIPRECFFALCNHSSLHLKNSKITKCLHLKKFKQRGFATYGSQQM